jgi:hypothetical protein
MQKWEYLIVERWINNAMLNQLGQQGWELVSVSDSSKFAFVFKRPAP